MESTLQIIHGLALRLLPEVRDTCCCLSPKVALRGFLTRIVGGLRSLAGGQHMLVLHTEQALNVNVDSIIVALCMLQAHA